MDSQGTATVDVIEVKPIAVTDVPVIRGLIGKIEASIVPITDQASYDRVSEIWKGIKGIMKQATEARKKITDPIDVARKAAMDLFRPIDEQLKALDARIRTDIVAYEDKLERERREEERRLKEIADREAEKERAKLEKKAERAVEKGNADKAAELQQQAAMVQPVHMTVQRTVEKPKTVSFREKWRAVVEDEAQVPRQFLSVDQKKLDKFAEAMKGQMPVSGVKFVCEKVVVNRG